MADNSVLALDINDDAVSGIHFTEEKRSISVLASHCCFRKDHADLAGAIREVVGRCRARSVRCHVSVGAENFHYRTLYLPFSDHKKIHSILPLEVQDSVSFGDEQYVFDCLLQTNEDEETAVLVALLKKELLREWLELLREHDLDPEVVTISGLPAAYNLYRLRQSRADSFILLDVGFKRASLFLVIDGQVRALRSLVYDAKGEAGLSYSTERGRVTVEHPKQLPAVLLRLAGEVHNTLFALKDGPLDYDQLSVCLIGTVGRQAEYTMMILESLGVVKSDANFEPYAENTMVLESLGAVKSDANWLPFAEIENLHEVTGHWPGGLVDEVLALACSTAKDKGQINFRKDEFARKGSGETFSRALKFGVLGLLGFSLLLTVYQGFDYHKMQREQQRLSLQVADVYRDTVEGATPGRDPVKELQVKVNELKETAAAGSAHDSSITAVTVLADISERIPATMQVLFERFIYDRKTIRVKGLTDNFNSVDQMKKVLEESPYFSDVSIGSANIAPKEEGVRFELKLEM